MTNEEAIEVIEQDIPCEYDTDLIEALNMAIAALKAEPCEDCVSREFMYKLGAKCIAVRNGNGELVALASIESLPSVTPKITECEDAVKREAVLNTLDTMDAALDENRTVEAYKELLKECFKALPPVTPKPTECVDAVSRRAMLDGLASIAKAKAKSDAQKALMGRVMFFTEKLPSVIPKQRWIPVSKRLPKTHGVYNVTRRIDGADITDSCFYDGQGTWYDDTRINHERKYLHDITAWMPLPEPYKEGESE